MTRRKKWFATIAFLVLASVGVAAYFATPALRATYRSTDHFLTWSPESRVRYEAGAEPRAKIVAESLAEAIATVERGHGRAFCDPVIIHVCATTESFGQYSPTKGARAGSGMVMNNRLFLSPTPVMTPALIPRILTHELSHLHLSQQLGVWRSGTGVPNWFREGLAENVSDFGGSRTATDAQCWKLIAEGKSIRPEGRGEILGKPAAYYGLTVHQFYRQSGMFVTYLKTTSPTGFQKFLNALYDSHSFERAFHFGFDRTVPQAWDDFVKTAPRS